MGVIANIRALLGRRAVRVYGIPASVAVTVEDVDVGRMYETQPALRTVVDFIARNIAQLPLKVYRQDGDDRVRDRDGTIARLIRDPNPYMTRYELIRDTVCDLKLYDFALWVVGRDAKSGSGWQIRQIPVPWVTEWIGDGFAYDRFAFIDGAGSRIEVDADSCVVFHGYAPGDPRCGSSAVQALKETIREQMSAQQFRRSTWDNAMRITGYIKRPPSVEPWEEPARKRFADSVRMAWGKDGERAGGTPVFEDGMEYHSVEFSTKEKDWAQGVQLSREEVAAAFHVNPALIWHSEGQTYASAKDNARALYVDTLAPDLEFIASRSTKRLTEITGDVGVYAEFDLQAKLMGSFEEQASVLQSSVGAPWMSRNEARARMNLPAVENGDELITPLNVVEGGLASPNDTDPTVERYNALGGVQRVMLVSAPEKPAKDAEAAGGSEGHRQADGDLLVKAEPTKETAEELEAVFRRFYERQGRAVSSAIGATSVGELMPKEKYPGWWDVERWFDEMSDDLFPIVDAQAMASARAAAEKLSGALSAHDVEAIRAQAMELCRKRSAMVNESAYQRALASIRDLGPSPSPSEAARAVSHEYSARAAGLSATNGRSLAQACANMGTEEGAKRSGVKCKKKWRTASAHPRSSHARMDGKTAKIGKTFSNGAQWPGDPALPPEETCNCQCWLEIVKAAGKPRIKRTKLEEVPESKRIPVDYSDNPRSTYGRLLKPGDYGPENIVDRGNEWRDLFAHDALMRHGFTVTTHGQDSIGISINGQLWEVKSFEESGMPQTQGHAGRFIESKMRKANSQFEKRGIHEPSKVVLNFRYRQISQVFATGEIERLMPIHNIGEVIAIWEDGSMTHFAT